VRTLVVSDLHLGTRLGHDVLRRDEALDACSARLTASTGSFCGDIVELLEGDPRRVTAVAGPSYGQSARGSGVDGT
jgi:hypothetical protein